MSVATEIIKKLPKKGLGAKFAYFSKFFDDFSGYRPARAKMSTDLESAQSDHSFESHKPYIHDKKFWDLTRGALKF